MQGRHNGILIDGKPVQTPKFLIVRQSTAGKLTPNTVIR
jgi:hypothetical protein